ncbi:MAG TPA: hypothetical protein VKX45_13775 [Bryobacteraceae bacterium]|jgi:VWFA-related protein|nr:hypothetical protein [Bryobacteraceae bacterium]
MTNIQTMERIADSTGGEALYKRNDIAAAVEEAAEDSRFTYVLGFYAANGDRDSKFHQLRVEVTRPGAVLHYRHGYAHQ